MTKKTLKEHKEKLGLIHKLIEQGGCKSKLLLAFKNSADILEAQIEQAKVDKLTCFDEKKYKLKKPNQDGWFE